MREGGERVREGGGEEREGGRETYYTHNSQIVDFCIVDGVYCLPNVPSVSKKKLTDFLLYCKSVCVCIVSIYLTLPALPPDPSTVFEPHLCSSSVTSF